MQVLRPFALHVPAQGVLADVLEGGRHVAVDGQQVLDPGEDDGCPAVDVDLPQGVVEALEVVAQIGPEVLLTRGMSTVREVSGREVKISSRPSDAIALAVRTGTPVLAAPAVLDEAGVHFEDEDEEDEVARFREFLEEVTVEDFLGGDQP